MIKPNLRLTRFPLDTMIFGPPKILQCGSAQPSLNHLFFFYITDYVLYGVDIAKDSKPKVSFFVYSNYCIFIVSSKFIPQLFKLNPRIVN